MRRALLLLLLFSPAGETYDVINYGAVCNGLTDDTAGVQAAVGAACAGGGGTVALPHGATCRVFSTIAVPCGNVYITGGGPGSTRLMLDFPSGPGVIFGAQATDILDVGIREMTILPGQTRTSGPGVLLDGTQRALVTDVEVTGSPIGIQVGSAGRPGRTIITRIERCRVDSTTGPAINAVGYAGLWIRSVHANGVGGAGTSAVLVSGPQGMDSLFITDLVTEDYDTGVFLQGTSGWNNANVEILGGMLAWVRLAGVRIDGAANKVMVRGVEITGHPDVGTSVGVLVNDAAGASAQRLTVDGCHATRLRQEFFASSGAAREVAVRGNIISGCALAGPRPAISVRGARLVSIAGNVISGPHDHAVAVFAGSALVHVYGNVADEILSAPWYDESGAWVEANH